MRQAWGFGELVPDIVVSWFVSGLGGALGQDSRMELVEFRRGYGDRILPMIPQDSRTAITRVVDAVFESKGCEADFEELVRNLNAARFGESTESSWLFARSGDGFEIRAFGKRGHFRGYKGFVYLHMLVTEPPGPDGIRALGMQELLSEGEHVPGEWRERILSRKKQKKGKQEEQHEWVSTAAEGAVQEAVDQEGKRDLSRRLKQLRKELAAARESGAGLRIQELTEEIAQLERYLNAANGHQGRSRTIGDQTGNMRSSIHTAIRRACDKLRQANPSMSELAEHFKNCIQAKANCFLYRPNIRIDWSFEAD